MSKLLTDLMEAERKRRQLAAPARDDGKTGFDEPVLRAGTAAGRDAERTAAKDQAAIEVAAELPTAEAAAVSGDRPAPDWLGSLAAMAVALVVGIGIGTWLDKSPAVAVGPWSNDQGGLRLRLDRRLANPPPESPHSGPRDRAQ